MDPGVDDVLRARGVLEVAAGPGRAHVDALFDRETAVAAPELQGTIGMAAARSLVALGLIRGAEGRYEPLARIDRVSRLVVVSDLRRRRRHADFVVGPGPASFLLARHVRAPRGGPALDLGCGSGIQGLLFEAAGPVEAVDINSRALGFARFNAALNGRRGMTVTLGDFLADEWDERYDGRFETVVANPPFVLAPNRVLTYRDRSLPGDLVSRRTVERVGRALAPGGRGYVLCNWIDRGGDWGGPVRGWIEPLGVDALILRVGSHGPADYAAIWTRDLPVPERAPATVAWAGALEAEGVRRIHVGLVAIGRPKRRRPIRTVAVDRAARPVTGRDVEDFLGSGHRRGAMRQAETNGSPRAERRDGWGRIAPRSTQSAQSGATGR